MNRRQGQSVTKTCRLVLLGVPSLQWLVLADRRASGGPVTYRGKVSPVILQNDCKMLHMLTYVSLRASVGLKSSV